MTKPVDYDELVLRLYALLRRSNITSNQKITLDHLTIDSTSYMVTLDDSPIVLAKKEFDLLFKFLSYPDRIFTKSQLLDDIWGLDSDSSEDTVKTHVNRLRNKLQLCKDFDIITMKGLGYKIHLNKPNAL